MTMMAMPRPKLERPQGADRNTRQLANAMRREYTQTQSPVIVGTDGGAQGKTFEERVASWAVSVGNTTVGGEVLGLDQTPKAAEYWAAERAIQAGVEAKVWLEVHGGTPL